MLDVEDDEAVLVDDVLDDETLVDDELNDVDDEELDDPGDVDDVVDVVTPAAAIAGARATRSAAADRPRAKQ